MQFQTALVATDESGAPIDVSKETESALEDVELVLTALNEVEVTPTGSRRSLRAFRLKKCQRRRRPRPRRRRRPSSRRRPRPRCRRRPSSHRRLRPRRRRRPSNRRRPRRATPTTTEKPPEEPTSPIPDTVFVKAKESVLEGQPTGSPIENQVVKLFPQEEPQLHGRGR